MKRNKIRKFQEHVLFLLLVGALVGITILAFKAI